jgi:hypothetical protein
MSMSSFKATARAVLLTFHGDRRIMQVDSLEFCLSEDAAGIWYFQERATYCLYVVIG